MDQFYKSRELFANVTSMYRCYGTCDDSIWPKLHIFTHFTWKQVFFTKHFCTEKWKFWTSLKNCAEPIFLTVKNGVFYPYRNYLKLFKFSFSNTKVLYEIKNGADQLTIEAITGESRLTIICKRSNCIITKCIWIRSILCITFVFV